MRQAIVFVILAYITYTCVSQAITVTQPTTLAFPIGTDLPIQWTTTKTDQIFTVNLMTANNTIYEIVSSTVTYNPSGYNVSFIFYFIFPHVLD